MGLAAEAPRYNVNLKRDMQQVQQKRGVTLFKQISDFMHIRKLKSGLSMEEYLTFSLFDKDRTDYESYIGDLRSKSAFLMANKLTSWDAASDKLFFSTLVSAANFPNPKIVAYAHKTRDAAGSKALRTMEDVQKFLKTCELPLFGKPTQASHGDGAVNLVERKGDVLITNLGEELKLDELAGQVADYLNDTGYIFQETLNPHAQIARITKGRLATARILVCIGPDGPYVHKCVMRFPAGNNVVDNFRRPGNLLAGVNVDTGELDSAVRGVGLYEEHMEKHPDTEEMIKGSILPDFETAKDMVLAASNIFLDLRIQSWDVALTDRGPVLLEMNPGGNFNIYQLANGRGLYDEDFRNFLEWCMNQNDGAKSDRKAFEEAKKLLKIS